MESYEIQITIENLNKQDYESLMVKMKELADASKREVKVVSKNFVKPDVIRRLPTTEDVKRWYQLLVGINEEAMQKDMEATFI